MTPSIFAFAAVLGIFCICCQLTHCSDRSEHPIHPLTSEFIDDINRCRSNYLYCERHISNITAAIARLSNDHAALLLHDTASNLFTAALDKIQFNCTVSFRLAHALSALAFSQGELVEVRIGNFSR